MNPARKALFQNFIPAHIALGMGINIIVDELIILHVGVAVHQYAHFLLNR